MKKQQKQAEERITALYARLSKDDEREGISGSIENQRIILERYAKENHLRLIFPMATKNPQKKRANGRLMNRQRKW